MAEQRKYKTKQREAVSAYLAQHCERYFSVDDVWSAVSADGARIGRSTVYRCLEAMATDGSALKATTPGGEARYKVAGDSPAGQLVCLKCGQAFALDCHMVVEFSSHVQEHHGFMIDPARTVLYGLCGACRGVSS